MDYYRSIQAMIYHRQQEGFRVGEAQCRACTFKWIAVIYPSTIDSLLECKCCRSVDSLFTEYPALKPISR